MISVLQGEEENFASFHLVYNLVEVLKEIEVQHHMTLFEADGDVAALAKHFNCPVLSDDIDFFVFNLPEESGCIPLRGFSYRDLPQDTKSNEFGYYISARIFRRGKFPRSRRTAPSAS